MSKESNPEVQLMLELRNAIIDGDPGGVIHRREVHPFPPVKEQASQNFGPDEAGACIAAGWKVEENLAKFDRAYEAARMPRSADVSTGFMGSEQESRIYDAGHYIPWFVAYRASGSNATFRWLCAFHALAMMSRTPEGRVLWVGQRGAVPGSDAPRWIDGLMDVATGGSVDRWRKAGKWGWPPDWEILAKLAPEIRAFHREHIEGRRGELLGMIGRFRYRTDRHWLHTVDGTVAASWCGSTVNSNTPPMMGAVRNADGTISWLPRGGGEKRIRSKHDGASCAIKSDGSDWSLSYSAKHSRPSPDTVEIDSGRYLWTTVYQDGSYDTGEANTGRPIGVPTDPDGGGVDHGSGGGSYRVVLEIRDGVTTVVNTEKI